MLNIFKKPIEKATLEAWAKASDDILKIAFLSCPVILYGEHSIAFKIANSLFLLFGMYFFLIIGRECRKKIAQHQQQENK